MGKIDASIRVARWLAAAIGEELPAQLTLDDVTGLNERADAFFKAIGTTPSPEGLRKLGELAGDARAQARRDRPAATTYIATALTIEALRAAMIHTLKVSPGLTDTMMKRDPAEER